MPASGLKRDQSSRPGDDSHGRWLGRCAAYHAGRGRWTRLRRRARHRRASAQRRPLGHFVAIGAAFHFSRTSRRSARRSAAMRQRLRKSGNCVLDRVVKQRPMASSSVAPKSGAHDASSGRGMRSPCPSPLSGVQFGREDARVSETRGRLAAFVRNKRSDSVMPRRRHSEVVGILSRQSV